CKLSIEDISDNYIKNAKILYTSGIAQSLSLSAKEAIKKAYEIAKEKGITTAYDPNYTPLLMTPEESKELFDDVISDIDIIFLSAKNDAPHILEVDSCEKIIKNLWDLGVNIVVVKSSHDKGYYTGYGGDIVFTPFFVKEIVDTTCSGDAFNGGFLHGISSGLSPFEATKLASVVSGLQSQKIGAVKSVPYANEVYAEYEKI
ncbi:MAG TPA: PfkB family carbohydrate kinase, partial [Candidatus Gastranaerophilaceae bacterium]|nr:PfkB family carbohydrate kinase [Candidatus Gastranaerophilaceae bacterium]